MKRTVFFLFITLTGFGLWANGAGDTTETVNYSYTEQNYSPVRSITVDPNDMILRIFADQGIDSTYLVHNDDYTTMTQEIWAKVNRIISDNQGSVVDLINGLLKSKLTRGGTEKAIMPLGNYEFTASLDYPE